MDAEIGNVLGPERFNTILGIVFLVIVLLSPGGLVGLWESARERLDAQATGHRRGAAGPTAGAAADAATDGARQT